jgi:hypothetical protein
MHLRVFSVLRALAAALISAALVSQTGASRFALAQVSDPRGKAVVDIGADDFVVQEAGAEREILDVRVADYPIAIVLDNTAGADDFDAMRGAAARFIDRVGIRPVAIVATGDGARVVAPLDEERPELLSKLEALEPAAGNSRPLRAMALAADAIRASGAFFSAIIVATASPAENGEELDASMAAVIDSRASVHVVHRGGSASAAGALRSIADQSHGGYTPIYAAASYQPALDRLASRLTTELLIEYIVPVGSKASDVKIGVRIPGARVRGLGVAPR